MNKTVKRILIGTSIIIVVIVVVMGGFMLKMKSEIKKMDVIETKEVVPNIFSVKDAFVNMYLIKDHENYVAIDAGNDRKVISAELTKLNIDPQRVTAVFLTHTDGDHVAAIRLFNNATLYLSRDEEQMINGKTPRMMNKHNKIDATTYILVDDQQSIKLGNLEIQGILTPGHTPGSMCYLINNKYLFVGDAFGLKNGKVDKPNKFFSKDMATALKSFDKITNLPYAKYVFTAHNGYSSDYNNAVNTELK